MNKRIGKRTEEGTVWPEVTISGQTYNRTGASTIDLTVDTFAVLDPFGLPDEAVIDELRELAVPAPKPTKKGVTGDEPEGTR